MADPIPVGVSPVTEPTIERLRELALKATAGPWGVFPWEDPDDGKYLRVARNSGGLLMPVARSFGDSLGDDQDTAYIAAVDPTTVLALLSEIASLRSHLTAAVQERDEARVAMNRFFNLGNAAGERAEKAEAALSATEEVVKAARDVCDELSDQVAPRIKAYVRVALSRLDGGGRS